MQSLDFLFNRFREIYPELVDLRRDFHMYPELSFQEVDTPQKIAAFLRKLGLKVRTEVGGRGVVGLLRGGIPGKTVALRADFDALPIQDEKDVAYKSRIPGVMHACGHDLHTSSLLGVAKVLSEHKDDLPGNVVFIHQFAEETIPGGAKPMIEDGCLEGVDVIYGAHVWASDPIGTIGIREGNVMAAMDSFKIDIWGRGGHGATPHLTIDSVVTGAQLITNLQQIVSRRIDPLESAVVTVGSFHGGKAFNVIAHSAVLEGTVRSFDEKVRDLLEESIQQITKNTCEAAGAGFNINYVRGYPPVCNHTEETQRVKMLANQMFGSENVKQMVPVMGGEDFAYYLKEVPGSFFFVGGGNLEIGAAYPHHHPLFDVDERAICNIGKLFISLVFHYLSNGEIVPEKTVTKADA